MSESKPQAPLMIGVSGLRGIVGESLTPEVAMRFAGAFGAWLNQNPCGTHVVVGRDGREGGELIQRLVMTILYYSGAELIDAGTVMTPTLGVLADVYYGHAVQITASHNPQKWNGIKLMIGGSAYGQSDDETVASAPPADLAASIISLFSREERALSWQVDGHEIERLENAFRGHIDTVLQAVGAEQDLIRGRSVSCVLDSVNCSGGPAAEALLAELACVCRQLHGDNSGIFPHTPEPTAENLSGEGGLCDAVPGLKADVGFAQDPDGDRLAIVDETGRYIGEEYTLALCAVSILEATKAAGELFDDIVLCANLSTSRMIDDIAATYGASVVRTAVGEANVVEAMKRLKREGKAVLLGGEGNGGVIWPEVTYVRDSLGSMALVLSLMARTGKTVSELVADIPSYAIVKRKQPLARKEDAKPAIDRIAAAYATERVDTQDGVRVDFDSKRAWVHVRASNTEPILRLIAEAEGEAVANEILDDVAQLVEG